MMENGLAALAALLIVIAGLSIGFYWLEVHK